MSSVANARIPQKNESAFQAYLREGGAHALALNNRGPIQFNPNGTLCQDILDAYWKYGFYVFQGVLGPQELADIEADLRAIIDCLPVRQGSPVDAKGRPALGAGCSAPNLFWSKPLADPFGATAQANGRHPIKMNEPTPAADAPDEIVYLILGSLQFSEACLRTYGHPELLKVAAQINGADFAPFSEGLFIKEPGRGASVSWHRDGVTHWDSPDWDAGTHGFNFMGQLYGCTPANGVWVVPGTHKLRTVDIKSMLDGAQSDRLPGAVPMVCDPGDVVISNRQVVHGSFANTSKDWRVTVNMGFHRRASVLGVHGGGIHNAPAVYDEARIRARSRLIGYGIDARQQRFPDETPYEYQPFAQTGEVPVWDDQAKADIHDYNLLDLSI